jgi:hypothetical protein
MAELLGWKRGWLVWPDFTIMPDVLGIIIVTIIEHADLRQFI